MAPADPTMMSEQAHHDAVRDHARSPRPGLIDIHSHLLVAVDDGCQSLDEALLSVRQLKAHGFAASICTPHVWPPLFPDNTPEHIDAWVARLQDILDGHDLDYPLFAGAEVRIYDGLIDWLDRQGVPTLADSNCVLVDYWGDSWDTLIDRVCDWLMDRGYQPVLAHPERINLGDELFDHLDRLQAQGVWLQGNFKCFTGHEGPRPDDRARRLLADGRYTFLAMDMHRPDDLIPRFEGIELIEKDFGRQTVQELCNANQRRLILGEDAADPV